MIKFIYFLTPKAHAADEFKGLEDILSQYYSSLIVPVGVALAAVVIIYAGILYATSQGQPDKINLAKEFMYGAIIGLIILLTAGYIVGTIIG